MDKGFWMPKGTGHGNEGDPVFDNSSRMEPKRARRWFLDADEPELFPSKKQVVEASISKPDSGINMSSVLSWENSSGFQSAPNQFMNRLFGSETTTPVNLSDAVTDSSNTRRQITTNEQFKNDASVGLSMSYGIEESETGVGYDGTRKVKVNQVKDPENVFNASLENTFITMGQPYGKEGGNVTYDIGDANINSTFGKGIDNTISITPSCNKGDSNTISFGGYGDESVMETLTRPKFLAKKRWMCLMSMLQKYLKPDWTLHLKISQRQNLLEKKHQTASHLMLGV
ncbi:hypothetical protein ACJIZ3_017937 [Penstemon smallii]|uniref:Uncharacterized protein n=1 Tax=Penstemon smallii TaxID=265156 RepID=A0ABD3SXR0_9LAMI